MSAVGPHCPSLSTDRRWARDTRRRETNLGPAHHAPTPTLGQNPAAGPSLRTGQVVQAGRASAGSRDSIPEADVVETRPWKSPHYLGLGIRRVSHIWVLSRLFHLLIRFFTQVFGFRSDFFGGKHRWVCHSDKELANELLKHVALEGTSACSVQSDQSALPMLLAPSWAHSRPPAPPSATTGRVRPDSKRSHHVPVFPGSFRPENPASQPNQNSYPDGHGCQHQARKPPPHSPSFSSYVLNVMINSSGIRITLLIKGHSYSLETRPQEKHKEGHRPVVTRSPKGALLYLNPEHQAPRDSRPQLEVDSWRGPSGSSRPSPALGAGGPQAGALGRHSLQEAGSLWHSCLWTASSSRLLPVPFLAIKSVPWDDSMSVRPAGLPEPRVGAHLGSWAAPGGPRASSAA